MTLTRFSCWPEFDHHWFPSPLADGFLLSDAMRNGKKWGGICLICEFKEAFFQCTYLYIKLHFFGNALSNYVTIYSIYFKYIMWFSMPWPLHLFILCKLQGHDLTLTSWPVCVGCGWGTGLDWFEVVNTGSVLFLCDPETVKRKLTTWKKLLHTLSGASIFWQFYHHSIEIHFNVYQHNTTHSFEKKYEVSISN